MKTTGDARLDEALWAGDVELLSELAPCRCCCSEHYHPDCPANLWNACRGSGIYEEAEAWYEHYRRFHGMSRDDFFDPWWRDD